MTYLFYMLYKRFRLINKRLHDARLTLLTIVKTPAFLEFPK